MRCPWDLSSKPPMLALISSPSAPGGTALGQNIRRFATSTVHHGHYAEGPGKTLLFTVENKWQLLAMMAVFFGSECAATFFIVRYQLLKK
uniref:cytochrome c oxidase subunit 7C, mitochondrial n=1 Tax=Jaculus jaculus TaxID=51337 RepID=UPI001E1B2491|nr:cytochrome c oxidase subunit 7C, mitochondrial [Jaculus jaculus]